MGLNTTINIKYLTANFIVNYIREGELINFTSIEGLDADVIEIEVKEGSNVLDNKLKEIGFPKDGIIGGVLRNKEPLIPRGDFTFEVGDRVLIVTKKEGKKSIEAMFK